MNDPELERLLSELGASGQPAPNVDHTVERLDAVQDRLRRMHFGIGVLLCYVMFTAPFFLLFAACVIRDIHTGPRRTAGIETKASPPESAKSLPALDAESATQLTK